MLGHKLFSKAWVPLILVAGVLSAGISQHRPGSQASESRMEVRGSRDLTLEEACSNHLISEGPLIQIPGPNPAIVTGGRGTWDESVIESCDAIKDGGKYYWYYHGVPKDQKLWPRLGYRIGVAIAGAPLGPFVKYKGNPLLDLGPEGSWDDRDVACAVVLKTGAHKYYMWYCGKGGSEEYKRWSIGLAMAPSPLGPWKKFAGNPILKGFGYSGGVVYHNGTYFLYAEDPIGSTAPDYGPISLATARRPEGPWTIYKGNPVLKAGDWGAWDDGGFSEAKVLYWGGLFHIFYGGAKRYVPRMLTRESIGYAYSFDGYHFIKYARNPVARRGAVPNAASFSEVHALFEPPYIYLYHTLRYVSYPSPDFPRIEHLGIQILSMRRDFRLAMPVLELKSVQPGTTTSLSACPAINVENAASVAVTVECRYNPQVHAGLKIHVRSSDDGVHYDTSDLATFESSVQPGETSRTTHVIPARTRFIKLLIENQDSQHSVSQVDVAVTLSGN